MLSLLGNILLWSGLIFGLFQFVNSIINKKNIVYRNNQIAVNGLLITSTLSFLTLIYAHIVSDFSLINVFQNSHSTKPIIYKISGVWGNHEGSMLLWILVLTIFNYFIFKLYKTNNIVFVSKTLETQSLIIIGFLLFTVLTSNPFDKMFDIQKDGLGFNPILQDPALAIHPPLLYIGYVGFSAAFSLSIATLSVYDSGKIHWYNYIKSFVTISWTFLTIGIALGSVWAYYELGWGGWWFWDPVENASFMPWLIGTALLHSLITVEKNRSLQSWVLLLSILAFLLSVIGTFLVRSGILTSVHTFALDPSRGIYILTFATFLGGYSLILFGLKSKQYLNKNYLSFFSKEGSILINNILMMVVCISVLLGTIYPLLIEALTNNKISVGEPYYNSTVVPIMIPVILVMGIGPILSWKENNMTKIFKEILPAIYISIALTFLISLIFNSYNFLGLIGVFLSCWIISNSLVILWKKNKIYSKGMIVAHIGIGFLILGVTASSIWQEEKIVKIKINNSIKVKEYKILFEEINEITGPNYVAIRANFSVFDKEKNIVTILKPENRFYPVTNVFTSEASIHTNLFRDLYIVLGDGNHNNGWIVRVYHNPLVIWIWIGALTIFFGGIISMNNNLKKFRKLQ